MDWKIAFLRFTFLCHNSIFSFFFTSFFISTFFLIFSPSFLLLFKQLLLLQFFNPFFFFLFKLILKLLFFGFDLFCLIFIGIQK